MAHGVPLEVSREQLDECTCRAVEGPRTQVATQLAGQLAEQARKNQGQPEEVPLWIAAGELYEFASDDAGAAFTCYSQAVSGNTAPAAAMQGLRRLARKSGRGLDQIGELYRLEYETAEDPLQVARAAVQHGLWLIRQGADQPVADVVRVLSKLDTQDPWTKLLALTVLENLHLTRGEHASAAHVMASRWELARRILDKADYKVRQELACLAASVGAIHRYLTQRPDAATEWYKRSFELVPSELMLRELVSLKWTEQKNTRYEEGLAQLSDLADTPGGRARAAFELGLLRAYRLGDREGAGAAFFKGMHQVEGGASCAEPFLTMVRSKRQVANPDDVVDALGLSLELAATPRERADSLYLMAVTFERDMHLPDAAIDVLHDALNTCPEHRPAAKALGRLYYQRGAWSSLAALLESEVQRDPGCRRSRMKLVEVLMDHLEMPEKAEPHLVAILKEELYSPAVMRLAQLYAGQGRWSDLYDLMVQCAQREKYLRDRLYRLEEAAQLAENRLYRPELATSRWQEIHQLDPFHPGALANLRRLLMSLGRWNELVDHNKAEIKVREEPEVATRIWTETGEIYERYLFDEEEAARCYGMALEINPTYEPALEALGRILWRNGDWDGLVDVYEAEISASSDPARQQQRRLDLGELQAIQADRPEAALATFDQAVKADGTCEQALLWLERVHQALKDDRRVLDIVEKRQRLLEPHPSPQLALRAASLAEWALDDPEIAWGHYLSALDHPQTRHHALVGLWRLWPRLHAESDQMEAGLKRLIPILREEEDPETKALMVVLVSRLERGTIALQEWAEAFHQSPRDILARAATDVQLSLEGRVDALVGLRANERLGSLWSLIAQMDSPRTTAPVFQPDWLPDSPMTQDILEEMDILPARMARPAPEGPADPSAPDDEVQPARTAGQGGREMADVASTSFRTLVRAWLDGADPCSFGQQHTSIPVLRLCSHHALQEGERNCASQHCELEAGLWSSAARRQERLVQAAELRWESDPRSSQELYRKALACGCYPLESREIVYASLHSHEQYDLLIEGLTDHVAHADGSKDRVRWLKRLALAQETTGRRNRALESWQEIIRLDPGSAAVHLEVVRLLTLENRMDEARTHLDRACLQQFAPADRLLLLAKVADLQVMEGGDGKQAIRALEEAVTLTGNDAGWLRRLARAHASYGDPERAMMLLVKALPAAIQRADLGDWYLLARLKYSHLGDREGARELLWGLLEQFPLELDTLKELEIYYRAIGEAGELAERLSTFLVGSSGRLSPEIREYLWEYLGDLNYHVLRRNRDAQLAYESAAATGGTSPRLALKVSRAVGQQPGKGREACARYAAALRMDGVGVEEWIEAVEDLEAIFDGIEEPARVRIIRQIGGLLRGSYQEESGESRIKRDPARQVEPPAALEKLGDSLVEPGSLEVIKVLEPVFERCFGDRRARRRELGGRRVRSSESLDLVRLMQLGSETIQSTPPRVYSGNGSDQPEWLCIGAYWMPEELLDSLDPLRLRFWAGHFSAAAAIGIHAVTLAQPGEIEAILDEIDRLNHGGEVSREPMLREVATPRFKTVREQLRPLLEQYGDLNQRVSRETWSSVPFFLADRFGLLLAGDVKAAVDSVLALEHNPVRGDRTERIVTDPRSRRILEYALSYAYQELRYLCGLAAKPRLL